MPPRDECPGCRSAIYDGAREQGWCTDCIPPEIAQLREALDASIDEQLKKLLAMSDEQITALTRLQGHDPADQAKLAGQAMDRRAAGDLEARHRRPRKHGGLLGLRQE